MFPLSFSEVHFTRLSISTNEYPEKKNRKVVLQGGMEILHKI